MCMLMHIWCLKYYNRLFNSFLGGYLVYVDFSHLQQVVISNIRKYWMPHANASTFTVFLIWLVESWWFQVIMQLYADFAYTYN